MVDFCAFFRRFFNSKEVISMETRVALIGIVVEDAVSIEKMNALLHQYGAYIIGRMGVPYQKRGINIISVAMDAPGDIISALSGKLGMLPGISTKTIYSKISSTTGDTVL
jgi:putative iron-only hydrogenase system regulator